MKQLMSFCYDGKFYGDYDYLSENTVDASYGHSKADHVACAAKLL